LQYKNCWWFFAMLNIGCAKSRDIILYAKLHFYRDLPWLNTSMGDSHNFILINVTLESHPICTCNFPLQVLTHVQKKLTWLCLCESLSNPRGKFGFHLQEPKISSPFLYEILIMKDELDAYFKIAFANHFGSPDWVALCKRSSLLPNFWPNGPPVSK
jgi:hypothetical protein